uniref:Uncharacterized protein n=1 Tax=Romanomermis culicivorax TaxID=13658 RepID=A0A915JTC7_ROMCU
MNHNDSPNDQHYKVDQARICHQDALKSAPIRSKNRVVIDDIPKANLLHKMVEEKFAVPNPELIECKNYKFDLRKDSEPINPKNYTMKYGAS